MPLLLTAPPGGTGPWTRGVLPPGAGACRSVTVGAREGRVAPHSVADAVPYATVRDVLSAARAPAAVVLDCCYAVLADALASRGTAGPFVSARPAGSFLLTSASGLEASFAPAGRGPPCSAGGCCGC